MSVVDDIASSEIVRQFMPGNHGGTLRRGGPGRPVDAAKREVLEMLRTGSKEAARALIAKARKGDAKAIELVLAYGIGKPTDKVELSGPDGGPLQFALAETDHEKRLLRDAIQRHAKMLELEAETVAS